MIFLRYRIALMKIMLKKLIKSLEYIIHVILLFGITLLVSCSSEVNPTARLALDMASWIPEDFNFEMYGEVELQYIGNTSAFDVRKIQVKRGITIHQFIHHSTVL